LRGQGELLEVVDTPHTPRRLNGGQEQRDQDGDDRDDHQQLD
jgi:hypothetical protein